MKREWLEKWKGRSDVERKLSPKHWEYVSEYPERAYLANIPTLQQYDALYGYGSASFWLETHVVFLFGSSSNRETGIVDGIRLFCQSFASSAGCYKLSELMLFFARYKSGRYDNSYSSFDARRIGNAFFREFIPERNYELDRIMRKMVQDEIEKRRFVPPLGYTSLSLYQDLKRRAEAGDKDAIERLKPPSQ